MNHKLYDTPEAFLLKSKWILIPLLSSISFNVFEEPDQYKTLDRAGQSSGKKKETMIN